MTNYILHSGGDFDVALTDDGTGWSISGIWIKGTRVDFYPMSGFKEPNDALMHAREYLVQQAIAVAEASFTKDLFEQKYSTERPRLWRVRFVTNAPDPRPIVWPIKYPYWITGESGDGQWTHIVAYVDRILDIRRYWPEAVKIDGYTVTRIEFSDRFPCPSWFTG